MAISCIERLHGVVTWVVVLAAVALISCGRTAQTRKPVLHPMAGIQALVPVPATVQPGEGPGFTVTAATRILVASSGNDELAVGQFLSDFIGLAVGPAPLPVQKLLDPNRSPGIVLALRSAGAQAGNTQGSSQARAVDESYELTVASERVTIDANSAAGLFYGVQTLRQLMPPFIEHEAVRADPSRPVTIPAVHIVDRPRLTWRGSMLDVARHFMRVDEVKRYIDLIALYKVNRLHLHLSDDQGWRIDIASRPNLAKHGATTEVGGGPGGYYTQQQYADIVAYAHARFITIVPEIEMPGHSNAALSSYPEVTCDGKAPPLFTGIEVGFSTFCVDKDATYRFIDDVVRDIAAMTPGPYFHIGGDEVKTLTPEQYARFIERVQGIVQSHGKQMIGWDETAAVNLLPGSIVQHWRPGTTPKAAVAKGNKIILSPADKIYLDMKYDKATPIGLTWAAIIEVRDAYDWEPSTHLDGVSEAAILGVEAPLWSETVANIRDVEYLAFPRLAAVAEVGWSAADRRNWDDFKERLGAQGPRWMALGLNFYRSPQITWRQ